MYAEILPNVAGLKTPFHYRVPHALEMRLRVGHLVRISFGKQIAQGIVVSLDSDPPAYLTKFKSIQELVDSDPVLNCLLYTSPSPRD